MKLLVLAFPRSGTRYIKTVLTSYGVQVGHESVERDGVVSWKHLLEPADLVVHQVRYPLAAITSCLGIRSDSREYMRTFTGLQKEPRLLFMAKAYLEWHELIENRHPVFRYRVEDLPWPRTDFTDHGSKAPQYGEPVTLGAVEALDPEVADRLAALTRLYGYELRE